MDYDFLEGTKSPDGNEIDVWKGLDPSQTIDALVATVDLTKMDSEIKILIGCTETEKQLVMEVHDRTSHMKGILVRG